MRTTFLDKYLAEKTLPASSPSCARRIDVDTTSSTDSKPFDSANGVLNFRCAKGDTQTKPPRTNVFDVAAYILEKCGEISALKLQKLVYYCQAWSLVWDDEPLFPERIEAWAYGPVVKELYEYHRGLFSLSSLPIGSPFKLSATQKETIDAVVNYYGEKTPLQLIELTHLEDPWKNARKGIPVGAPSSREITLQSMQEYYASLI